MPKLIPTADDLQHLEGETARKLWPHLADPQNWIRKRIIVERAVVRTLLTELAESGHWFRVYYGENDFGCDRTDNVAVAMECLQACDEEWIWVYSNSSDRRCGFVMLVYGNDGWDVIADNSQRLEPYMARTTAFADSLADEAVADLA